MFECLFAKKVDKNKLTEIIEKASEKHYVNVTFKLNGNVEVFIGGEREDKTNEGKD